MDEREFQNLSLQERVYYVVLDCPLDAHAHKFGTDDCYCLRGQGVLLLTIFNSDISNYIKMLI